MKKKIFSNPIEDIYKMKEKDITPRKEPKIEENMNSVDKEYNEEKLEIWNRRYIKSKDEITDKFENKYNKIEQNNTSIIEEILGRKAKKTKEDINVNSDVVYSKRKCRRN